MAISLQSYNDILGKMIRKIIADTPVNDLNTGSVLLTLLEAVAAQDFENNVSILSVLETLNIDSLKNLDLDVRAADYGLSRITSTNATGFIKISDSSITKKSTTLYGIKPAPIAGDNKIFVNNAQNWGTLNIITNKRSGVLYIGRGTQQFEGPIPYYDIVDNGSFYEIKLGTSELSTQSLQKDHLSSDTVVDGQQTIDRLIPSGTVVKIPSNNQSQEIRYFTLRDSILPAGEDSIDGIPIVAEQSGSNSNAGLNAITNFETLPFNTATVSNTSVLSDGRDTESDDDLRERIKNYSSTLSRGTRESILSAIVGISDPTDGKQVSSAVLKESPTYGEPSIIYVDDGSGFQPTTQGQSVDVLLQSANGGEQFLQLSNFPLPRPQIINQTSGPIELTENSSLIVSVDGEEQEVLFTASYFNNIAAATLLEICSAINNKANQNNYNFRCRLTLDSSRLLLYPVNFDAEFIQVMSEIPSGLINANSALKFPTNKSSYISLYKNNTLLRSREYAATLTTLAAPWTSLNTSGDLVLSVDGTPPQTGTFTTSDFDGTPISSVTPAQWAEAINKKFAGVTATATSNGKIQISSNRIGAGSSLTVVGGQYVDDWFSGENTSATGSSSDFKLNRQTGNLKLTVPAEEGDLIAAGNEDAKGYVVSSPTNTGTYDLTVDAVGRPSEMVVVADDLNVKSRTEIFKPVGTGFKVVTSATDPSIPQNIMRIVCEISATFEKARVGDYVYVAYKSFEVSPIAATPTWFAQQNTGLFKIQSKGDHTLAGVDTYIDVVNVNNSALSEPLSGYYLMSFSGDIQVFGADLYPQIWKSSYVSDTVPVTLQQMINSFDEDLLNVKGSLFKTNMAKLTSSTENDGSIAVPVSIGKLSFVVDTAQDSQLGNQSHIATRITTSDMLTWFKRGSYIQRTSTNTVLPDRTRYTDVAGLLTNSTQPGTDPLYAENLVSSVFGSSSTALDDVVNITSGPNKSLFRNLVDIAPGNEARTRKHTPNTVFDYLVGNSVEILKPLSFSSDDSIVFVLDGDAVNKTINVNFWRTGRINSLFLPTTSQFSADDADNESGVNFSSPTVWSTSSPLFTNFEDYAVWFCSRNWYRSGGSASSDGTLIVRAKEFGPIGDTHRFNIEYPSSENQTAKISHSNNPEYTTSTYYFGSGARRATAIDSGTLFSISKINTISTTQVGTASGEVSSGDYFFLQNTSGKVVFWYALNNDSTPQPTVAGAIRYIKINTVNTGDTAAQVAQKTQIVIDNDDDFSATVSGSTISYFNNFNASPFGAPGQNAGLSFTFNTDTKSFRYTFQGSVNLTTVLIGDVLSVSKSGLSNANNGGTFRINNANVPGRYVDIYNPNGAQTNSGRVNIVDISNVAAAGIKMVQDITTTQQGVAAGQVSSQDYFILNDQSGSVVFWYDVDASGAIQPSVPGAGRFVKIDTVNTGDTADTVASKTSTAVGSDIAFSTSYTSGSTFSVTNNFVGPITAGTNGFGISFVFSTTTAGADDAIGGTFFKIFDGLNTSVAVWFNVDGEPIPDHACTRAIQVILSPGDSANTVASKTALAIEADSAFNATSSTNTITISNANNGIVGLAADGASPYNTGFTVTTSQTGQNDTYEISSSADDVQIYPLESTSVLDISNVINTNSVTITAVPVGSTSATISKATREELLAVGYGHDTNPSNNENGFIRLYDGSSLVRSFANSNPNFVLKTNLTLQGQEPTIYDMATCPNPNTADVGELFKLIPKTIQNVKHHITHKALSQLSIVADTDIAGNFRRLQIKSKKLGTQGGVEIVGGRANIGELDLISSAGTISNDDNNVNYLVLNTQAYPNTFNSGEVVKIYNTLPAKRTFKPDSSVNVQVTKDLSNNVKYFIGSRNFSYSPFTKWTISDISSTYGANAGAIWRWTHNEAGAKALVNGKVQTYDIVSINSNGTTATVTLSSNHNLVAGQPVVISGIIDVPALNGTRTVLNPTSNQFQFSSTVNAISLGGKVTSIEIQSTKVFTYPATGNTEITSRLRAYDFFAGTSSSPMTVSLTVDSLPNQADYFLITGPNINAPGTTLTFAVWFDIDSDGTAPTGAPFLSAAHDIKVDINSTDSINTIASKLSTALNADSDFSDYMQSSLITGTSLSLIQPGDIINVWPSIGDTHLTANWPMGNQSQSAGSLTVSGFHVLNVNATSRYMDVINPNGRAMSTPTFTDIKGNMTISPPISTRFKLKHKALNKISIAISSDIATATTLIQHGLPDTTTHGFSVGDIVQISDTSLSGLNSTFTITETPNPTQFKFTTSGISDATYLGCAIISTASKTRYRFDSLGFKDLFKIQRTQGDSPRFADCGVSVDDFVEISGNSFNANNRGRFRVLAVDNDSLIIQNPNGVEELDTYRLLNYRSISATWTAGSTTVTGSAGAFSNVAVGRWIRSADDNDGSFAQVLTMTPPTPSLATSITLGQVYTGVSGVSQGVVCDFEDDVNKGSELMNVEDIKVYDCDSTLVGDSLVIGSTTNSSWFSSANSGQFTTTEWGTDNTTKRQYVMISNPSSVNQSSVSLSIDLNGMYLLENNSNLYETIRTINNAAISGSNVNQRLLYATPNDRSYKMSSDYGTKIMSMGKLGFPLSAVTGIDGYIYYTGLMRTVQRTIDGYEPDSSTYPGRRAVGSTIEPMPPLIKSVSLVLKISTRDGVNLNDITNDIKSTIIAYVSSLGVGSDVVLSEIIRRTKGITGVDAVTFVTPSPSLESISINDDEKAFISPDLISLS